MKSNDPAKRSKKLDPARRQELTDRVEDLLEAHCRNCGGQEGLVYWTKTCRPAPVCPVLIELQELGKGLGFTKERNPSTIELDEDLLAIAKKNGISERTYRDRIKSGRDPVEATKSHKRPNLPSANPLYREFLNVALDRDIPRSTYRYRIEAGWTPQEAASYRRGAKLEDIREGKADGLYIV